MVALVSLPVTHCVVQFKDRVLTNDLEVRRLRRPRKINVNYKDLFTFMQPTRLFIHAVIIAVY